METDIVMRAKTNSLLQTISRDGEDVSREKMATEKSGAKPKKQRTSTKVPAAKNLPPFGALRAFDAVARHGGIRKAALQLDRNHAVISRHIRTIESWTGAILVERLPSGIVLTEEGERYHKDISTAIEMIANATVDLVKRNDTRSLQICCSPGFALHWLVGKLGEFEAKNPLINIEMRPTESTPDFATNEADIDLRMVSQYGEDPQVGRGVRRVELARVPLVPVASQAYLDKAGAIRHPSDLLEHQLLHERGTEVWSDWFEVNNVSLEADLKGPLLWQGHLTVDAARHGRGVALSNHFVIAEDIANGKLVNIGSVYSDFDNTAFGAYEFSARSDRWDFPSIRNFRMWLRAEIVKELSSRRL